MKVKRLFKSSVDQAGNDDACLKSNVNIDIACFMTHGSIQHLIYLINLFDKRTKDGLNYVSRI